MYKIFKIREVLADGIVRGIYTSMNLSNGGALSLECMRHSRCT